MKPVQPDSAEPRRDSRGLLLLLAALLIALVATILAPAVLSAEIGREVAIERHLQDGEEFTTDIPDLMLHGKRLFEAVWTSQEGGGRPLTKGTGAPLADMSAPLEFPRSFNRLSAPDSNSCAGCHNIPRSGGGGDFVANVFVLAQRFDFATFDHDDPVPTGGSVDEQMHPVELQTIANSRNTLGMFGAGYIEMLARQMTAELQRVRDAIGPGAAAELVAKGVSFGVLARELDGSWDTSGVEGLAPQSLAHAGPDSAPSLIVRPFHQAGAVISLRQFSNNAFNHHHGIQSAERFGAGQDPDGDGYVDEMTVADVTAVSLWQAQLAVPGRVIPRDETVERAVWDGERLFAEIGCADCHVPSLPLDDQGWVFTEPGPYNPAGDLQPGDAPLLALDLSSALLDPPRLRPVDDVVHVPAYTDLKLHDITSGEYDANREPLNMHLPAGSEGFFAGNGRFLTRKLWGVANEPPYFHHGKFTTLREAVEAHHGEAADSRAAWTKLEEAERGAVIEFLKSLQVLPVGTTDRIVDETGQARPWPPASVGGDDEGDDEADDEHREHRPRMGRPGHGRSARHTGL